MVNQEFVKQEVAAFLKISAADLNDDMVLSDLIADSFMIVELMMLSFANGVGHAGFEIRL